MTTTRRGVLTLAAASLLAGTGAGRAAEDVRLRLTWWGNPDRDRRTFAAIDAYQAANPNVRIDGQALGWGDYWPKLATQTVGGNAPDIIQMDYRYLYEYARRGVIRPLDGLIELPDFSPPVIAAGTVDGKLQAISLGGSGWALYYNADLFEQLGVPAPQFGWSWADYEATARRIAKAGGGKIAGAADMGGEEAVLEIWLLQKGKSLYDKDGKLGFTQADVEEWFRYWEGLRAAGVVPPPDVTSAALTGNLTNDEVVDNKAAISFAGINQVTALQGLTKAKLGMVSLPERPGGAPGVYVKPSQFLTIASTSKQPEAAAAFIKWMVTDPVAVKILGVERGVPGSAAARDLVQPDLDRSGLMMVDYMQKLSQNPAKLPPPPPKGAGENEVALKRIYPQIGFGKLDPATAAKQFYEQAQTALARAG